jgi:hypothetical protein
LVAVVSACGQGTPEISLHGDDPRIATHNFRGVNTVGITGTLGYDADSSCLFLTSGQGGSGPRSLPVWPDGTNPVIHEGRRGVEVPGIGRILEGDPVRSASSGGPAVQDLLDQLSTRSGCGSPEDRVVVLAGFEE